MQTTTFCRAAWPNLCCIVQCTVGCAGQWSSFGAGEGAKVAVCLPCAGLSASAPVDQPVGGRLYSVTNSPGHRQVFEIFQFGARSTVFPLTSPPAPLQSPPHPFTRALCSPSRSTNMLCTTCPPFPRMQVGKRITTDHALRNPPILYDALRLGMQQEAVQTPPPRKSGQHNNRQRIESRRAAETPPSMDCLRPRGTPPQKRTLSHAFAVDPGL